MRRREFLGALGGTAMWPLGGARAQQSLPFIAFLSSRSAKDSEPHAAPFLQGLSEAGYVPGQNLRIEYRWADGHYERLQELATELVGLRPAVLVAGGGEPSAVAAKSVTANIPIVFVIGGDPVKSGLTASLNRPNTNATGVSIVTTQLGGKRVHLMSELSCQMPRRSHCSSTQTWPKRIAISKACKRELTRSIGGCLCSGRALRRNWSRPLT
jgi:ABC-type uncharacterized transport system substrate-binding protein